MARRKPALARFTDTTMTKSAAQAPWLSVDEECGDLAAVGVKVDGLAPEILARLDQYELAGMRLESLLSVKVAAADCGLDLPDVGGSCRRSPAGLRFDPIFPFDRDVPYRAIVDLKPIGAGGPDQTLEFSFPNRRNETSTGVSHIFPSADHLPENLLRLYVMFSRPMRRGHVEANIRLLGPDGEPAEDVLYRPPIELWDRRMRCLTLLLDPGRLKRHVGPNRALGPPLKPGETYSLEIGEGMLDLWGAPLLEPVRKTFVVSEALRRPIAPGDWTITQPTPGGCSPLRLSFPYSLDWAMLEAAITVVTMDGSLVLGNVAVDRAETGWSFTPNSAWSPGVYEIRVAADLEDVCGNTPIAAFDRPLRAGRDLAAETASPTLVFRIS